jgi:hypothetical protein
VDKAGKTAKIRGKNSQTHRPDAHVSGSTKQETPVQKGAHCMILRQGNILFLINFKRV